MKAKIKKCLYSFAIYIKKKVVEEGCYGEV